MLSIPNAATHIECLALFLSSWNQWMRFHLRLSFLISLVLMCSAGQSMNRWSLEEMVKRDPENFLILLQQIIRKTREVGHTVNTGVGEGGCLHVNVWSPVFVFRCRSSASMSWWLLWPSCSSPHCCRYLPSSLCRGTEVVSMGRKKHLRLGILVTWASSQWSISAFCDITKSSFLNWCLETNTLETLKTHVGVLDSSSGSFIVWQNVEDF